VAESVSETLDRLARQRNCTSRTVAIAKKRRLLLSLREQLAIARNSTMDDDSLRRWMIKLQEGFSEKMAALELGSDTYSEGVELDDHPVISEENLESESFKTNTTSRQSPGKRSSTFGLIIINSESDSVDSDNESVVLV
jgi:DNA mismatch repair protein MSH4